MPTYTKKTSNYTAVNGDYLIGDTSGGSFTITLPASPVVGSYVVIVDGADWSNNNLTINRNGSTIENLAQNVIFDIKGVKVELIYDGDTWEIFVAEAPVEPEGTSYTSKKIRFNNAEQFKEAFTETEASVGYIYISKHIPWANEADPSIITDTVSNEKYIWDNMIAAKKVTGNDLEFVIPRLDWVGNVKYMQYDDTLTLQTLLTSNVTSNLYAMYAFNSERNVYKCLSNNLSSNSTVEPLGTNLGAKGIIQTADGYLWKYLYNIEASNKFLANNWLPAPTSITQLDYDGSANAAIDGEITTIVVTEAGNNYYNSNINVSSFSTSCTVLTVDAAVDMANLIALNMGISGNGIVGGTHITAIDLVNRKINLSFATSSAAGGSGNTLAVATRVIISGDGTGAVATANLSSNTIQKIILTSFGSGYAYANVEIYGTATDVNVAEARVIISPKFGHGYNSAKELGGHNVMINLKVGEGDTSEGNLISANTSFRAYGLLRNPHKYGANTPVTYANSNSVVKLTTSVTLIAGTAYNDDEFVFQGNVSSPTFSGFVESSNGNTIELTNVKDTISVGSVLKSLNTNPTGRTVTSFSNSEFQSYTGDILYNENIVPIQRSPGQAENIRFVVKF